MRVTYLFYAYLFLNWHKVVLAAPLLASPLLSSLLLTNSIIYQFFTFFFQYLTFSFPSIFSGLSKEGTTNNAIDAFNSSSESASEENILTRVER